MHPNAAAAFFSLDEVGVIVGDGQVVGLERFFRDADAVHGVPAFVVTQQAVALPQFGGFNPLCVFYFAPVVMPRRGGERGVSLRKEGVDGVGDDGLAFAIRRGESEVNRFGVVVLVVRRDGFVGGVACFFVGKLQKFSVYLAW